MIVFADTSALFALLVRDDTMHIPARDAFARLADLNASLLTSSYVLVENTALVQRRIGLRAVHDFNARIVPLLDVVWADADWHARAVRRLLSQTDKGVSLVDCLSFEIMEAREISTAFTFDRHFAEQRFCPIPPVT
jgi:uncharacterized protein